MPSLQKAQPSLCARLSLTLTNNATAVPTVAIHSAAGLQGIHHFGYEMCSFARAAVTNSHTLVALVIEVYHLTVLETASPRPSLGDIF